MFQIQLRDKNESLLHRVESLQGQYGNLATTKTDLSTQLLMTEEEKLKVWFHYSVSNLVLVILGHNKPSCG